MYLLIPSELDIRAFIANNPPSIPNFCLQKLLEVIHHIYKQGAYQKWKTYDGAVQIHSGTFFNIADDYSLYNKYLADQKIIFCDNIARPAKEFPDDPKSFAYKFLPPYDSCDIALFDMYTLKGAEKRIKRRKTSANSKNKSSGEDLLKEYPFIKFLDELDLSNCAIQTLINQISQNQQLNELAPLERVKKIQTLSGQLAHLLDFQKMPSRLVKIDKFGRRLHSPLTRTNKVFRRHLTYKGEHLVSLDIKNCQAYLALALMKFSFWVPTFRVLVDSKTNKGKALLKSALLGKIVTDRRKLMNRPNDFLALQDLLPELGQFLWFSPDSTQASNSSTPDHVGSSPLEYVGTLSHASEEKGELRSILNVINRHLTENQAYRKYQDSVSNGSFYEQLSTTLTSILEQNPKYLNQVTFNWSNDPGEQREVVKLLVMKTMFGKNQGADMDSHIAYEMFYDTFTAVCSLFDKIKKARNYKDLCQLLQRIESFLILKVCVRDINSIYRNQRIPLWTIHDSIITTPGYVDEVQNSMKETFKKYIGISPKIKVEYWEQVQAPGLDQMEENYEDEDITELDE